MTQFSQLCKSLVPEDVKAFVINTLMEKRRNVADVCDHCMHQQTEKSEK